MRSRLVISSEPVAPPQESRLHQTVAAVLEKANIKDEGHVTVVLTGYDPPVKFYVDRTRFGVGFAVMSDILKPPGTPFAFFDGVGGVGLEEASWFDVYNLRKNSHGREEVDVHCGVVGKETDGTPHYAACKDAHFDLEEILRALAQENYEIESPAGAAGGTRNRVQLTLVERLTGEEVDGLDIPLRK